MTFEEALAAIRRGARMTRDAWRGRYIDHAFVVWADPGRWGRSGATLLFTLPRLDAAFPWEPLDSDKAAHDWREG